MDRKTSNLIVTLAVLDDTLKTLGGTPVGTAIFTGCKCKLFTGATVPTINSVVGDFTETTAVGYSAATVATWLGPFNVADGKRAYGASPYFVFGDNTPNGVQINGYYLTNAAGTTLLAAERFVVPVDVVDNGDALLLDLALALPTEWQSGV